ncbi:hypothetical protein BWQ96_07022 [Gracilariopsis chorda]|uniref:Uncharacterized protein n=1 Tax=Gracilariopsis chorda TaxID=448386 RepID=A0A2V3IMH0_9FLOR|nr:hypothetical protein BWQ96_07022 [Gracilariopsis chorda]|eukprot:PXF43249.1 hypothetical protein BWQ96_07022 [Gracilariopsis chorda]
MAKVPKPLKRPFLRPHNLILLLTTAICATLYLSTHTLHSVQFQWPTTPVLPNSVNCVQALGFQNNEGIGQALRRNQMAVFVAEMVQAKLSLPNRTTAHGYALSSFFDHCDMPAEQEPFCTLDQSSLLLNRCERADCDCLQRQLAPYVQRMAHRCKTIGVVTDNYKSLEYAGCLRNTLTRYFGGPTRWKRPYDAVHFRLGDLAHRKADSRTTRLWMHFVITFLCKHSDRDIIVVTQGNPTIPRCGSRVVLASNTTIQEAFGIFQHATWTSMEHSGLAIAMMQISRPQRVILSRWTLDFWDWLVVPSWTIVDGDGALFHFDSKELAMKAAFAGGDLSIRSYRNPSLRKYFKIEDEIPSRRWQDEALPPVS